jgi:hypothetical protein
MHRSRLMLTLVCSVLLLGLAGPVEAALDLEAKFTAPGALPNGEAPSGQAMTFKVEIRNNGPDKLTATYKVALNRFDHTGQQFLIQVGTKDLLPLNAGQTVTLEFTEANPPAGSFTYKIGLTPYFTDTNNNNHRPEKFVKFLPPSPPAGGTASAPQLKSTLKPDVSKVPLATMQAPAQLAQLQIVSDPYRTLKVGDTVTFDVALTKIMTTSTVVSLKSSAPTLLPVPSSVVVAPNPPNWEQNPTQCFPPSGAPTCPNGHVRFTAQVAQLGPYDATGATAQSVAVTAFLGQNESAGKRVLVNVALSTTPPATTTAATSSCGSQNPQVTLQARALVLAGDPVTVTASLSCVPASSVSVQVVSSSDAVLAGNGNLLVPANQTSASYSAASANPPGNLENVTLRPFLPMLNPIVQGQPIQVQVQRR